MLREGEPQRPEREATRRCSVRAAACGAAGTERESHMRSPKGRGSGQRPKPRAWAKAAGMSELG